MTTEHLLPLAAMKAAREALTKAYPGCDNPEEVNLAIAGLDAALQQAAEAAPEPQARHCQSKHPDKDVCWAAHRDGVLCADGECDIDEGVRIAPSSEAATAPVVPQPGYVQTNEGLIVGQWYWCRTRAGHPDEGARPYQVLVTSGIKYVNMGGMRMWCDPTNDQFLRNYEAWGPIPTTEKVSAPDLTPRLCYYCQRPIAGACGSDEEAESCPAVSAPTNYPSRKEQGHE